MGAQNDHYCSCEREQVSLHCLSPFMEAHQCLRGHRRVRVGQSIGNPETRCRKPLAQYWAIGSISLPAKSRRWRDGAIPASDVPPEAVNYAPAALRHAEGDTPDQRLKARQNELESA